MTYAYVGNWNASPGSQGINVFDLDSDTGHMRHVQFVEVANPSFLAVSTARAALYAGSHSPMFEGQPGGGISAYSIDGSTGKLSRLNAQVLPIPHPAYVRLDRSDRFLLVACTSGGGVGVLPLAADHRLGPPSSVVMHAGRPLIPLGETRTAPGGVPDACQPHSIMPDLGNRFAFVPDLRLNEVVVYRFDADNGTLERNSTPSVVAAPGSGPRHSALHPDGNTLYVVNENGNTVSVFAFDGEVGRLTHLQDIWTLPADFTGESKTADIHVDRDGRFLYASNRGHDSIAVYAVEPERHTLRPIAHEPALGKRPRGFAFTPDGRLLMVANQDSNRVVALAVDGQTGRLQPTGEVAEVLSPTCITYLSE